MSRLSVVAVMLCSFTLISWATGGSVGASSICDNSTCAVAASLSPISLLVAIALTLFVLRYRQRTSLADESKVVGIWRRFGAFFLDFVIVLMVASSLGAVPLLTAEAYFTGSFQWAFEREFARATDFILVLPAALGALLLLFFYFYQHPRVDRQTVGQYVFGYRVMAAEGADNPQYGARVLLSFIGLCMWPISVAFALRTKNRAFWWDAGTYSRTVRVDT